jgi:hypothetical protein
MNNPKEIQRHLSMAYNMKAREMGVSDDEFKLIYGMVSYGFSWGKCDVEGAEMLIFESKNTLSPKEVNLSGVLVRHFEKKYNVLATILAGKDMKMIIGIHRFGGDS